MKKIGYIGLILGIIFIFNSESKAQYFYSSYGYAQDWHVPQFIHHSVYDNYYGFEIAHVKRYKRHGYRNYNVLLHRNGWFVELRFDHHGHIYRTIRHKRNYPLMSHSCNHYCGYHKNYYKAYYPKYHHNHYGHGHHYKKVYVETHHYGNGYHKNSKKYHHGNKKYYTNIHVEKQHKKNDYYHKNRQKNSSSVNKNSTRQRGAIAVPNNSKQVRQHQPSNGRSRSAVQRSSSGRSSAATSRRSSNVVSHNNKRSSRRN